ncbi:hypothetical protein MJH12_00845, partial [bacterium]|nr:hypothetical protein [bacterium]
NQVKEASVIAAQDELWIQFDKICKEDLKEFLLNEYVHTQAVKRYLDEVGINLIEIVDMPQDQFVEKFEDFLVVAALQEWIQNQKFGYLGYESRQSLNQSIQEAIHNYLPSLDLSSYSGSNSEQFNEKLNLYLEKNLFDFIQENIDGIISKPHALKELTENYLKEEAGSEMVNLSDLNSAEGQKHMVSQYILSSLPKYITNISEQFKQEQKVQAIGNIKQEVHSDEQDDFLSRWDQLDEEDEDEE